MGFYLVWEARKDFLSKGCLRFECVVVGSRGVFERVRRLVWVRVRGE